MLNISKYGPWVLVTGASSGIGKQFALQLSRYGFSVVLVARRLVELRKVASLIDKIAPHVETRVIVADLARVGELQTIYDATKDITVGLLVNCAGAPQVGSLWNVSPEIQHSIVQLNSVSPLMLILHFGNAMIAMQRGGIINVSSRMATATSPVCPLYCATKAFLSTLSIGISDQLKGAGVDCLVTQPGKTLTDIVRKAAVFDKTSSDAMTVEDVVDITLAKLGRKNLVSPGWRPWLNVQMRWYLPRSVAQWLLDGPVLRASPELLVVEPYPEGHVSMSSEG